MIRKRTRRRLPHWEKEGAIYFVTFRSADSLPQRVLREIEIERRNIVATAKAMSRELSKSELDRLSMLFTQKIDSYLDAGAGECLLARPNVARIVAQTISHFDELRYRLFA